MKFHRLLTLLAAQTWAMHEPALEALLQYVEARGRGEAPDLDELKIALSLAGRAEPADSGAGYVLDRGVAVIDVEGPLVKRESFCFTSMEEVGQALAAAVEDPRVQAILLNIDSPGGTVAGTAELAAAVLGADAVKPVHAYADGLMASAAYWIGSAARSVAAPASAMVGSIGTRMVHYDYSRQHESRGVKVTHLSVGAFKAAANDAEPLSEASRGYLVENLTGLNDLFVQAVAASRGLSPEAVLNLEAKVFVAGKALEAGLVDRIVASRDDFINLIVKEIAMPVAQSPAAAPDRQADPQPTAQAPQTRQGGQTSASQAGEGQTDASLAEAATAERARVLAAVETLLGADAKAKVEVLAGLGLSADQMQAAAKSGLLAVAAAAAPAEEKDLQSRQEILGALQAAGSGGVNPVRRGGQADAEQAAVSRMADYANRNRA